MQLYLHSESTLIDMKYVDLKKHQQMPLPGLLRHSKAPLLNQWYHQLCDIPTGIWLGPQHSPAQQL